MEWATRCTSRLPAWRGGGTPAARIPYGNCAGASGPKLQPHTCQCTQHANSACSSHRQSKHHATTRVQRQAPLRDPPCAPACASSHRAAEIAKKVAKARTRPMRLPKPCSRSEHPPPFRESLVTKGNHAGAAVTPVSARWLGAGASKAGRCHSGWGSDIKMRFTAVFD